MTNGIYKKEKYASVSIPIGDLTVELQSFLNPQIRTGVSVTGHGVNSNCFGALVDHYSIKSLKLKNINDIQKPKLIEKFKYDKSDINEEFVRKTECTKIKFIKY